MSNVIDLMDGSFALKFPYHIVSEMTVAMATRGAVLRNKKIKFAGEDEETAGTKRMNAPEMEKHFPIEIAFARQMGLKLSEYILIQAQ